MGDLKSKRGRPVTGRAKSNRLHIRLTDESDNMLGYICEKKGLNKTELVEDMIRTQYNLTKFME